MPTARTLFVARLYYLAFSAALGSLIPFFNVYLEQRGLSGTQIGLIASLPPIVSLVAGPFWSAVADRRQAHQRVLALLAFGAGAASFAFLRADGFWSIMAVLCVVVFFRTPVLAILDGTVMGIVARHPQVHYGRQRVFGSMGWVLASAGGGFLVGLWSLDAIFWLHGLLLVVVCTLLSLNLPVERSPRADFGAGLKRLLRAPSYRGLLLFMVLFGMSFAAHSNFTSLTLLHLGATSAFIGIANASGALLEVPAMFLGHHWFRHISYRKTIVLGGLGFAVAWLGMALAARPLQMLVAIAFSGLTYALLYMAIVGYANDHAPDGLRASAQGFVQAAQTGLGWALGSALSGLLWDAGGGRAVFLGAAALVTSGVLAFALALCRSQAE